MLSVRTIRNIAYAVEILLCFVLQGAQNIIPEIALARPVLLICGAVTISFFEEQETAVIIAMICGLLIDISAGMAAGPSAIVLVMLCFLFSKVFGSYFRINVISGVLCGVAAVFALIGVMYLLECFSSDIVNTGDFFINRHLPVALYTSALMPVFYFINKGMSLIFHY